MAVVDAEVVVVDAVFLSGTAVVDAVFPSGTFEVDAVFPSGTFVVDTVFPSATVVVGAARNVSCFMFFTITDIRHGGNISLLLVT